MRPTAMYRTAGKAVSMMMTAALAVLMVFAMAVPVQAAVVLQQQGSQMSGNGPETAMIPTGQRQTLGPDEIRWYTFEYDEGADEEDPSEALAELIMARPDSIDFEVWTEDDVRRWRNGEDFNPTGAGTPAYDPDMENDRDRSRLTWVGSGAADTTWYIVVENDTSRAAPYTLDVTGSAVYFPEMDPISDSESAAAMMQSESTASAAPTDDTPAAMDVTGGIGPATALTPTGARRALAPGETRWYTFRYAEGADADDPSEAVVEMAISRPNSIDFEVWTEEDVQKWANGVDFSPTGAGTPAFAIEDDESDNRDRRLLRWVGSGAATTTWFIRAENVSDATAFYRLTVTGSDVYFPDGQTEQQTAAEIGSDEAASETMDQAAAATSMDGGTGPNNALTPTGMQRTLAPDEMRWYTFDYTGGANDEDPEAVIANLRMAQPDSVSFEVWTEDDVQRWQNGVAFEPTGAGTPAFTIEDDEDADNRDETRLRWVGSGQATTTWYIVVENETDAPADYRLTVTGQDVSF